MSVVIITDSATEVPENTRAKMPMVPLSLFFGEEEYQDGISLTTKQFYEKLAASENLPRSSQATPLKFAAEFQKVKEQGDTAVVITLSSLLSGTYQSARIAAEDFPGTIYVVDSMNATIGSGILAELALQFADSGMSAAEIAERITKERDNVRIFAVVNTLENLKKGGRISTAAAFAGELLSIKPLVCIRNGRVELLGKARGARKGHHLMNNEIEKAGGVDFDRPVLFGYTGLDDHALQKYVEDSEDLWEGHLEQVQKVWMGSVIGTHVGPDAAVVAFFPKQE